MKIFELARHWFIPHTSNNHRSKALHLDAMLFYVLVFAVFNLSLRALNTAIPDVLGYATDIHVEQLLADTNAERAASGLQPLSLNAQLSQAAALKAQDMFAKNYWAHNSPTGSTPWDFVSQAGYRYVVAGENLAKNFSNSQSVVSAWKASPTHWANIIKPSYKEIGFAVVNVKLNGEETTLVVQMFGTSADTVVAKPPMVTTTPILADTARSTNVPNELDQPAVPVVKAQEQSIAGTQQAFTEVSKTPMINIPTLTRRIVYIFAGVLMFVLLMDAWVVSKKKIVRVAGHNIAHFLFLSAVIIIAGSVGRGVLL